jgi:hypothetical protein
VVEAAAVAGAEVVELVPAVVAEAAAVEESEPAGVAAPAAPAPAEAVVAVEPAAVVAEAAPGAWEPEPSARARERLAGLVRLGWR